MSEVGDKIKRLRESLGLSQEEFGALFGVEQATVSRWEMGRPVRSTIQKAIAERAGLTVAEFFHSGERPRVIPVIGEVSAGERFTPDPTNGHEVIELSLIDDYIAVRVRGDSMSPAYRNADIVIGRPLRGREIIKAIERDCILLTSSGEGYLKILIAGTKPNVYNLRSYNVGYKDVENVRVEMAAPVVWIHRSP